MTFNLSRANRRRGGVTHFPSTASDTAGTGPHIWYGVVPRGSVSVGEVEFYWPKLRVWQNLGACFWRRRGSGEPFTAQATAGSPHLAL